MTNRCNKTVKRYIIFTRRNTKHKKVICYGIEIKRHEKEPYKIQQTVSINNFEVDHVNRKREGGMADSYFLNSGPIGLPHISQKSADVYNSNSTISVNVPLDEQLSLLLKHKSPTSISVSQQESYKETGFDDSLVETSNVSQPVHLVIMSRTTEVPSDGAWSKLKKASEDNTQGGHDENQFVEKQVNNWIEVNKKKKTE